MEHHTIFHGNINQGTLLIDIATRNVICLAPGDSIGEAARSMAEMRISSIIVTEVDGHPAGIITERNILHAMQSGCSPETVLRQVMSSPVITVPASMTCIDAYQVSLRDGIRHLVIVDDDKLLIGVVSETDFRLHISLTVLAGRRQVVSVMSRSVFNLPPECSLRDALNLMQSHRDICVVIVEAGRPVGIITERDIVRLYASNPERIDISVSEVMTSPVLTISLDDSISEAAKRMLKARVRHLVVVDHAGRMAGLLSEHDLTNSMALGLIDDKLIAEGAFLNTLVNSIPDMVWLKDVKGVYLACNPRFERFFGAREKEIIGKTDYDFVDKEQADSFREHDRMAMGTNGASVNEEWVTYADDGHRELLETIKTPMCDKQGKLIGVLSIARDITSHKQLEEELKDSENKFHLIFESANDCIELISMNGRILDLNHVGYECLGYTKAEMQGKCLAEFVAPEYAAGIPEKMALIKSQGHVTYESARLRKDGSIMPTEVSSRIVELGGQLMFLSISRDISERKRAEVASLESERRYRTLVENSPFCIYEIDREGRLLSMNRIGLDMHNLGNEKMIYGVPYLSTVSEQDGERVKMLLQDAFNGTASHFEFAASRVDAPLYFKSCFIPIKDIGGNVQKLMGLTEDVTERKLAELAIHEQKEFLASIFENALDAVILMNSEGVITGFSQQAEKIFGWNREEVVGLLMHETIVPPRYHEAHVRGMKHFLATGAGPLLNMRIEIFALHRDGHEFPIELSISPIKTAVGYEFSSFIRDISERKKIETDLCIAATVFESQEGMLVTDANNLILRVNRAFTNITGYTAEDVIGKNPRILQSGRHDTHFYTAMWESVRNKGGWEGEIWNRRKNGEIYPEHLTIAAVKDQAGIVTNYVATLTDITMSKAAAIEIEHLAFYDPLTGLANRRLLYDRLKQALVSSARSRLEGALLYIDLDNFKTLNDTLGHDIGDILLQQVAERLNSCVREGDTVARLGGDEFVIMLEDLGEQTLEAATQSEIIGNKILSILNQPYQLAKHKYHSTPSIGVALFNEHNQSVDDLLKQADIAMYQAKKAGRNALRFFDPQMQAALTHRVELEADLYLALVKDQFKLYYQPQVYHNCQIIGAEVLIRWQHPRRGLVSPADFIPLAEDTGLILPIGQWVLETACAQLKIWEGSEYTRHLQLAVNVSVRQFHQADFVAQVSQILYRSAINPGMLKLEITETLMLDDINTTILKMNALREIGVRFSMDDFGTGYSSLFNLKKLPIDQLKIDQSFVRDILIDSDDAVIVQTIISMTENLGMEVIAEGVETEAQRVFLEQHGCLLFQGYLFSKPVPIEQFEVLLCQSQS